VRPGPGHHLLLTEAGPLDLLGAVATGDSYDDLAGHSTSLDLGNGLSVRVLDLGSIIAIKERLGRLEEDLRRDAFRTTTGVHATAITIPVRFDVATEKSLSPFPT